MKYYNETICTAYNQLILEEISNKIEIKARAIWKDIPENDLLHILENFWINIRLKTTPPQNDINFWFKKPFEEFKSFVENYKSNTEKKTEQKYKAVTTKDGKGIKIAENDEYELWKVDSYDASKELGRFYKGYSTEWCISTDNIKYWNTYYYKGDRRIYFLIGKNKKRGNLNKIAILVDTDNILECWNTADTEIDQKVIKGIDYFIPYIKYYEYDINDKGYIQYISTLHLQVYAEKGEPVEKIKECIEKGADIHHNFDYALRIAAHRGNLEVVTYLVEKGADIHIFEEEALRYAAKNGHFEVVKYLVEQGADIHTNNNRPLRWAAYNGHLEIVKYLVEKGADIYADSNYAVRIAIDNGYDEIAKYLKDTADKQRVKP